MSMPRNVSDSTFTPRPRLVLFDLDNTICDYNRAREARTRYAFSPYFPEAEQLEAAVLAAIATGSEGEDHLAEILCSFGITETVSHETARVRYIEDRYRGLQLFDDALDVLHAVRAEMQVGMVTNGPTAIQRPKIDLLRIAPEFPVIVVSEEVGVWKPDPAIFAIALEAYACAPEDAIYVGDSATHDIPGAHAAGMRAVWMNRDALAWPGGPRPDAEVRNLYELLPILGIDSPYWTAGR